MSEIPSTIDLIMERTRGMGLTAEEKRGIRLKDLEKKSKGIILRLLEDPENCDAIIASINDEPEKDGATLRTMVWNGLVESLPAGKDLPQHLDILEKFPQAQSKSPILGQLRDLWNTAQKNRTKDTKALLNAERKKLAAFGISGSAVIPKIDKDAAIQEIISSKLNVIKTNLLDNLT